MDNRSKCFIIELLYLTFGFSVSKEKRDSLLEYREEVFTQSTTISDSGLKYRSHNVKSILPYWAVVLVVMV